MIDLDLCPLAAEGGGQQARDRSTIAMLDNLAPAVGPVGLFDLPSTSSIDEYYPGWCVITGDNGSGKSTILKAIALAILGPDKARYLQPSYVGWVSYGENTGEISVEIRPDAAIDKTRGGAPHKNTFWAEIDIASESSEAAGPDSWIAQPSDHFRKKKKGATNGPWQSTTDGWLALGYGPFRRLYGSSPAAAGLEADPIKARFATLFMEDATLIEAERWLLDLDYRSARAASEQEREQAAATLASVTRLLRADFLRNGMQWSRVDAGGVWLKDSRDREIRLADMSEGYRAALAMLIDILRHMILEYGSDGIVKDHPQTGDPYVDAPAVVLIDEIDAHLHPAWQQEIGFWLKGHFPRVQFIVTTHSPLVCQAADGGRIYTLPPSGSDESPSQVSAQEYLRIVSGDSDQVLQSSAFGIVNTRSKRVRRALDRHARLKQLPSEAHAAEEQLQLEFFLAGELPD